MKPEEPNSREGEGPDFRALFDRYYVPITSFFHHRGFSVEESRDLAQETFLRAFRGYGGFRRESKPEIWLFSIALNVWRNHLRWSGSSKRSAKEVSLGDLSRDAMEVPEEDEGSSWAGETQLLHDDPVALEALMNQERMLFLRKTIAELPPQMRRCSYLSLGRGLGTREIADLLQISKGTVRAHLYQARKKLRVALAPHFSDLGL